MTTPASFTECSRSAENANVARQVQDGAKFQESEVAVAVTCSTASLAMLNRPPLISPANSRWCVAINPETALAIVAMAAAWSLLGFCKLRSEEVWGVLLAGKQIILEGAWNGAALTDLGPLQAFAGYIFYEHYGLAGVAWLQAAGPMLFLVLALLGSADGQRGSARQRLTSACGGVAIAYGSLTDCSGVWWGAAGCWLTWWALASETKIWRCCALVAAVNLAWSNLHGSYPLGVLLSCSVAAFSVNDVKRYRKRLSIAVAATVSSSIHLLGPASYLQGWLDFFTPNNPWRLDSAAQTPVLASVLALALIVPRLKRKERSAVLLCAGLSLASVLLHGGWTPIWAIAWVIVGNACRLRGVNTSRADRGSNASVVRTLFASVCVLTSLVWSPLSRPLVTDDFRTFDALVAPSPLKYFAKQAPHLNLRGRVLCPVNWTNELAYHAPDALPFPGRRASEADLKDYKALENGHFRWTDISMHHGLRYMLVNKLEQGALWSTVMNSEKTSVVYEDQAVGVVELLLQPVETHAVGKERRSAEESERVVNNLSHPTQTVRIGVFTSIPSVENQRTGGHYHNSLPRNELGALLSYAGNSTLGLARGMLCRGCEVEAA